MPMRARMSAAVVAAGVWVGVVAAQSPADALRLPAGATLEGSPSVRVESSEQGTTRTVLPAGDRTAHPLTLRLRDGLFYTSANVPLQSWDAGGFTYLTPKPGSYIRLRRVNDRISYVEHLDEGARSVTYWGELRILLGK